MKVVSGVFLFAFLLIGNSECARILGIFPTPSISHQVVYHALMRDLAARGHHLTILTADVLKSLEGNPNVTQIDLHNSYEVFHRNFNFVALKNSKMAQEDLMDSMIPALLSIIEDQLSNPEVKKLIRKEKGEKFDVMIMEYLNYISMMPFADVFDCPIIGISSLDAMYATHEEIGNGANPVINPEMFFSFTHGDLSLSERFTSLKFYLKSKYILVPKHNQMFQKQIDEHFPMVKASIEDLKKRLKLMMTNTNPAMGFVRPLLPNTIQLGFMHIEPAKPLPTGELKTFLDNSKHGVIYMSLGSNVQSKDLSPEILNTFLKVFGSLQYDVLWKFEADILPNKPKNVMISKWTPQADLLAHPKVKLFITQGGQQSMEETVDRAVPAIVIPFIGDQETNAKRMVSKGFGYKLELHTMTTEKLSTAIHEMLKPKYKESITKLRELVHDQPMTSREKAVWWTEYVIRHKGLEHFEYPGNKVPFYQKYWLDFVGIAFTAILVFVKLIKIISCALFSSKKVKSE